MSNTLNTRIQLKYDTYAHWMSSTFKPLAGEVCIAEIPSATTNTLTNSPPAIGIKVGDGTHTFSELDWIQGIAGDVYSWAKAANKPGYAANEITMNTLGDNPTSSNVQSIISSLNSRINTISSDLDALSGGEGGAGSISTQITSAIDLLDVNDISGFGAGKTLASLTETDGLIAATFQDIAITSAQVSGLTSALNAKAPLASPALTGTPTAPTATAGTNTTQIATTAFVKSAVDTAMSGLSGAMHFIGTATVAITDGSTTDPTISGYTFGTNGASAANGDVVLYGNKEFVWNGSAWEELGHEGSYALDTVKVEGGDGLSGGGNLTENRTITHAVPTNASAGTKGGTSGTRTYVQSITTDKFGHITGFTSATETVTDTTYTFAEGSVNGQFSVTPSGGSASQVTVHGLNNAAYKDVVTSISTATTDDTKLPTVAAVKGAINGLDSSVSATAASDNVYSVLTGVTQTDGKLTSKTEVTLAKIAKTGSVYDIAEGSNATTTGGVKYLILDCGSATVLVD